MLHFTKLPNQMRGLLGCFLRYADKAYVLPIDNQERQQDTAYCRSLNF